MAEAHSISVYSAMNAMTQLVEALRYKLEGREFDS
jgi:hypothetical protein